MHAASYGHRLHTYNIHSFLFFLQLHYLREPSGLYHILQIHFSDWTGVPGRFPAISVPGHGLWFS